MHQVALKTDFSVTKEKAPGTQDSGYKFSELDNSLHFPTPQETISNQSHLPWMKKLCFLKYIMFPLIIIGRVSFTMPG